MLYLSKRSDFMFSYKRLWKLLIDKELNKTQFMEKVNISRTTADRMKKNQYVDMSSLDKICNELNCSLEDIVEHIKD